MIDYQWINYRESLLIDRLLPFTFYLLQIEIMKNRLLLIFIVVFSFNMSASILLDIPPLELIKDSKRVLHIKVVQATLKEYTPEKSEFYGFDGVSPQDCGVNIRARILYDYLGEKDDEIVFTVASALDVGYEYLVFLSESTLEGWFTDVYGRGLDSKTHECREKTHLLKAEDFPQRAILIAPYYDAEAHEMLTERLFFGSNNLLLPEKMPHEIVETGHLSQHAIYRVPFQDYHEYLIKLIANHNLSKATPRAKNN